MFKTIKENVWLILGKWDGTVYVWDTEHNLVVMLQRVYKTSKNKAVITYERTPDDDKEGCDSHNNWEI